MQLARMSVVLSLVDTVAKIIYKAHERFKQYDIDAKELLLLGEHITNIKKLFESRKGGASSSSKPVSIPYEDRLNDTLKEVLEKNRRMVEEGTWILFKIQE